MKNTRPLTPEENQRLDEWLNDPERPQFTKQDLRELPEKMVEDGLFVREWSDKKNDWVYFAADPDA